MAYGVRCAYQNKTVGTIPLRFFVMFPVAIQGRTARCVRVAKDGGSSFEVNLKKKLRSVKRSLRDMKKTNILKFESVLIVIH